MCAKHAHACTLYVRRLIPKGIMDVCSLQGNAFFVRLYEDKKDAQRPYDHFAEGIAPRSLLCVWKRTILFLTYSAPVLVRPSRSEFIQILRGVIPPQLESSFNYWGGLTPPSPKARKTQYYYYVGGG